MLQAYPDPKLFEERHRHIITTFKEEVEAINTPYYHYECSDIIENLEDWYPGDPLLQDHRPMYSLVLTIIDKVTGQKGSVIVSSMFNPGGAYVHTTTNGMVDTVATLRSIIEG